MGKQKKRTRVKNIRASYPYKPDASLSAAEKRVYRSIIITFSIILIIALGLYFWGTEIVYSINNFWRNSSNNSTITPEESAKTILLSPRIDPLPLYTNKRLVEITGWAQEGAEVAVFINDTEVAKILTDTNGRFEYSGDYLNEGTNVIYAKTIASGSESEPSANQSIEMDTIKPEVNFEVGEVDTELNQVEIKGTTTDTNTLYINDKRVIIQSTGEFSHIVRLTEGDNNIKLYAEDLAGNITEDEVKVTLTEEPSEEVE
jgi:hypothetical protein